MPVRLIKWATMGLMIAPMCATAGPVDDKATTRTRALFHNLRKFSGERLLFGHENATFEGIGWKGDDDRCDVKAVCGDYPAVYGWDMNRRKSAKRDGRPLIDIRIEEAFERGGINTVSWHMANPVSGENFYDTTRAVGAILPGGEKHDLYKQWLDGFADFATSLQSKDGGDIPLIFRPFHEHTGSWFWWGKKHCSREEYIALWRFTVDYLRDAKDVHNLLYAYSPAKRPGGREGYLDRYPGDDYIDVLGLDFYTDSMEDALPDLRMIVKLAKERGKIPALTECGVPKGKTAEVSEQWYTRNLLEPIASDPLARKTVWVLLWQNSGSRKTFWIPPVDHPLADDFRVFYEDPFTAFQNDLPDVYKPPNDSAPAKGEETK